MSKRIHYVEYKIKIDEIKNILFTLEKTDLDDVYIIRLNHYLYDRFVKVQKITGIKNKTIDFISTLLKKEISLSVYIERELIRELSGEIDKQIINDLINLKFNK